MLVGADNQFSAEEGAIAIHVISRGSPIALAQGDTSRYNEKRLAHTMVYEIPEATLDFKALLYGIQNCTLQGLPSLTLENGTLTFVELVKSSGNDALNHLSAFCLLQMKPGQIDENNTIRDSTAFHIGATCTNVIRNLPGVVLPKEYQFRVLPHQSDANIYHVFLPNPVWASPLLNAFGPRQFASDAYRSDTTKVKPHKYHPACMSGCPAFQTLLLLPQTLQAL